MKKVIILIFCLLIPVGLFAQPPRGEKPNLKEIRDTLRFVRLAESKKRLSFDEDKLLKVNEILDVFEEQKFALIAREHKLRKEAGKNPSDEEATRLLDDVITLKREMMDNDISLWTRIRETLTPRESIEFFMFYEKFSRDVQRRIRMLQQRDRGVGRRRRK